MATSEKMKHYQAAIWAQHGLFVSGPDLDTAFGLAHTIEKSAEIYVKVLSMGGGLIRQTITDDDLRAIARESPIDEFHRMSIAAFGELAERAVAKARETFSEVTVTADGADLEGLGLHKPSATWTYMVNDNPLSSSGGSVVGSIAAIFR